MRTYHVYMLLCADGSYYTGVTNSLDTRVWQHESGIDPTCYTFKRRPVRLVYATEFRDVLDAISWEKHLKRWKRAKKAALVSGAWDVIHELARCKNDTVAMSSFDSAQDDIDCGRDDIDCGRDDIDCGRDDDPDEVYPGEARERRVEWAQDDIDCGRDDIESAQDDIDCGRDDDPTR